MARQNLAHSQSLDSSGALFPAISLKSALAPSVEGHDSLSFFGHESALKGFGGWIFRSDIACGVVGSARALFTKGLKSVKR
jgi:hypothetical protein